MTVVSFIEEILFGVEGALETPDADFELELEGDVEGLIKALPVPLL